jgi:hypothetical protein
MKKILLLSALCSITFFACKKKTEDIPAPTPLVDYALSEYLKQTGFDQTSTVFSGGVDIFERGTVFEPQVAGNLTAFVVNLPSSVLNLKIILWNATTMQPITSTTINFAGTGQDIIFNITPVPLQKNEKYCVSLATEMTMYKRKRTDGANATYPVVFKNIKILSHNVKQLTNINLRAYPTDLVSASYYGDVSFKFQ